jgi:peptidoglycan/LPS O-acetylase OafA/YrhL
VLAVVLYHFAPGIAPGGFLGVDVFFVLSGFLITSLLVVEWERDSRILLPTFWLRRARRLLPALMLVLTACGVWALVVAPAVQGQHVASDGLAAFSYVANWHFIASSQAYLAQFANRAPSPLQHMWSLAVEEQFYLAWPLLVAVVGAVSMRQTSRSGRRRRAFRRTLVIASLALAAGSIVRMWSLYHPGGDPSRVYYGTDTHAAVILLGAALGAVTAGVPLVRRGWRAPVVILGALAAMGIGIAVATVSAAASWLYEGGYAVVGLAVVAVLVAAVQPGFNPLRKLLETRVLVGLGLISYGVYLWHWPFVVWLTHQSVGVGGASLFAVRAAATLALAIPSYYFVELPIRHGRLPRLSRRFPGLVPVGVATVVAAILLVGVLAFPSVAGIPTVTVSRDATRVASVSYAAAPRCDSQSAASATLGTPTTPFRVQLVGNSFAGEISDCLATILRARGGQLTRLLHIGDALCLYQQDLRRQLKNPNTKPAVAVLFQYPFPNPDSPCSSTKPFAQELSDTISEWRAAGVHVVLVRDIPPVGSSTTTDETADDYRAAARRDPAAVTVADAGVFIRDASGRSQWRMPCVGHELGCGSDGTVGVRWPGDHLHFCSDPDLIAHNRVCASKFGGGERRVAAAVASVVVTLHPTG